MISFTWQKYCFSLWCLGWHSHRNRKLCVIEQYVSELFIYNWFEFGMIIYIVFTVANVDSLRYIRCSAFLLLLLLIKWFIQRKGSLHLPHTGLVTQAEISHKEPVFSSSHMKFESLVPLYSDDKFFSVLIH